MQKFLPHSSDWHFTEAMPKWVSERKADFLFPHFEPAGIFIASRRYGKQL
jgi:hypothetical protein